MGRADYTFRNALTAASETLPKYCAMRMAGAPYLEQ